jgi:hypothetical protein
MAAFGLMGLLGDDGLLAAANSAGVDEGQSPNPLLPRATHFPGRAKRVIHLFLNGGP